MRYIKESYTRSYLSDSLKRYIRLVWSNHGSYGEPKRDWYAAEENQKGTISIYRTQIRSSEPYQVGGLISRDIRQ